MVIWQELPVHGAQEPPHPLNRESPLRVAVSVIGLVKVWIDEHAPARGGYVQEIRPDGLLFTEPPPLPSMVMLTVKPADVASVTCSSPQIIGTANNSTNNRAMSWFLPG